MRRFLSLCIIFTILLSMFSGICTLATDKLFVATLEYDGAKHNYSGTHFEISVNGKDIETPIPPIVLASGRSIVPVREIFEAIGAEVYWTEGEPSRVVIANADTTVSLALGDDVALVNGKKVKMEVPAKLVAYEGIGKTMVPIRFVAQTLDMQVDYDDKQGLISITEKDEEPEEPEEVVPSNKLTALKSSLSGDTLTVKLTFSEEIEGYTYMTLDAPYRVVVDVKNAQIATEKYSYTGKGNITKIRLGDYENMARTVFDVQSLPEIRISLSSNKKVLTVLLTGKVPEKEEEKEEDSDEQDKTDEPTDTEGPIVVIDAGHGGSDPGAIGYDDEGNPLLYEKNVNLNISRQVYKMLVQAGVRVYMTRDDDSYISLDARTTFANELDADLFISIHCNSYETTDMNGSLVMHHTDESVAETYGVSGREVANNILKYLPKAMDTANQGRLNGNAMYVIRKANMPSVIVETAFISNAEDRAKLADAVYRTAAAKAIVQGILDTLCNIKRK